ncbi:MAG TPA: hypothetical protein VFC17_05385, partial [Candidatus Limnocylindrales bacterium]|nr:hypothetical protein [Candidatus Limnocylindrales bacterium]
MKPEVVFVLEGAAWPAMLVGTGGAVLLTNSTAQEFFGISPDSGEVQLAAFWAPENGSTATDFLLLWEKSPVAVADLKFRPAAGAMKNFSTAIALLINGGNKWFVLQLLPHLEKPAVVPVESAIEFKTTPTGDAALKQKLDCVLQLARTVS